MKTVLKFASLFLAVALICGCSEESPISSSTLGFKWKTLVVNPDNTPIVAIDASRIRKEDDKLVVYWKTISSSSEDIDVDIQKDGDFYLQLSKFDCNNEHTKLIKISVYNSKDFFEPLPKFIGTLEENERDFERVLPGSASETVMRFVCKQRR